MSLARWKDLCLDAHDQAAMGTFWARVIGLDVVTSPGKVSLDGTLPEPTGVDERRRPAQAGQAPRAPRRLRRLLDDLVALGATVLAPAEDTGSAGRVMADPEGGEFCAFVREPAELPAYRLYGIGIDAVDARALAAGGATSSASRR